MKKTVEQRFWEKVGDHSDSSVCWLWAGGFTRGSHGKATYGTFYDGTKTVYAHRFAYELLVGPIPEGTTLDHVKAKGCTSTLCVNPSHLESVSVRENILRGDSFAALEARQVCCLRGHIFNEANTYMYQGQRCCRACNRESHYARYHRADV